MTLAAACGLAWLLDRRSTAMLVLCVLGVATAALAYAELGMMHSATPVEFGEWLRWYQLPNFVGLIAQVLFVNYYLGTARQWLMWAIIFARSVVLVVNFSVHPNFNFSNIVSLRKVPLFGEQVSAIGVAVTREWQWLALASVILLMAYVIDAAAQAWLKGDTGSRRKALAITLGMAVPMLGTISYTQLVMHGFFQAPLSNMSWFVGTVVVMSYELGRDFVLSSRARLELSENLRLILDSAAEGIYGIDLEGRCTFCNQACLRILGYDRDDALVGRDMHQLTRHRHADGTVMSVAESRIREVLRTGLGFHSTDEVLWNADGTSIPADLWCYPQLSGAKVVGAVVGFGDNTQRKQAEDKASKLQDDLAHLNRVGMLSALSGALAHEINQPLAAVRLNVESALLLSRTQPSSAGELHSTLSAIQEDSRRAGDVLQRARTLLKKDATRFEEVGLNSTVSDVVKLIQSSATKRGIVIDSELAPEMQVVWGDRVQIQQVVLNLLMNACDAVQGNEKSARHVSLRTVVRRDCAVVEVKDWGAALSDEHLARIFEPFYTTKQGGMGLGLSICRAIVAAHGGTLDAIRNRDAGITFFATFPYRRPAAMSHDGTLDQQSRRASS